VGRTQKKKEKKVKRNAINRREVLKAEGPEPLTFSEGLRRRIGFKRCTTEYHENFFKV